MCLIQQSLVNVLKRYTRSFGTFYWSQVMRGKISTASIPRNYKETCLVNKKPVHPKNHSKYNRSELTRWEEHKESKEVKWKFLEHKGPVFTPPYASLPTDVKFIYDGKEMKLSHHAEEVAVYYAKMLTHEYTTKTVFNNNFFQDWRETMNEEELGLIIDFSKCNFQQIHRYVSELAEEQKLLSREDKKKVIEKNNAYLDKYRYCIIDGQKEKVSNFRIEPPGLFRGRGDHPKMGKLKKRIQPEDVIINCSQDSKIPKAPPGHEWKEVRHDPTVVWLAAWSDNIQNKVKYIMLDPCSRLRSEMDIHKFETARKLHKYIHKIRKQYQKDWRCKDLLRKQRAVALYFIDRLALRAGYEKDEDELDTVGCCSLRTEHIKLHKNREDESYLVTFDFIGKDAIRYCNEVLVERLVFENLKSFLKDKQPNEYIFDLLTTYKLNKYLNKIMKNLSAKVFRTYNASIFFQQQLHELTNPNDDIHEKLLSYGRANRVVAILCNHKRTTPKGYENQIENLEKKIDEKYREMLYLKNEVDNFESLSDNATETKEYQKKIKKLDKVKDLLAKLETQKVNKNENKSVALSTSKLNYIDPRISVAWCKKYNVPIEKIYNKSEREKFHWAISNTDPNFLF